MPEQNNEPICLSSYRLEKEDRDCEAVIQCLSGARTYVSMALSNQSRPENKTLVPHTGFVYSPRALMNFESSVRNNKILANFLHMVVYTDQPIGSDNQEIVLAALEQLSESFRIGNSDITRGILEILSRFPAQNQKQLLIYNESTRNACWQTWVSDGELLLSNGDGTLNYFQELAIHYQVWKNSKAREITLDNKNAECYRLLDSVYQDQLRELFAFFRSYLSVNSIYALMDLSHVSGALQLSKTMAPNPELDSIVDFTNQPL